MVLHLTLSCISFWFFSFLFLSAASQTVTVCSVRSCLWCWWNPVELSRMGMGGWGWQVPPEHQQCLSHYTNLIARVPVLPDSVSETAQTKAFLWLCWEKAESAAGQTKLLQNSTVENPILLSSVEPAACSERDLSVGTSVPSCRDITMSICFSCINL